MYVLGLSKEIFNESTIGELMDYSYALAYQKGVERLNLINDLSSVYASMNSKDGEKFINEHIESIIYSFSEIDRELSKEERYKLMQQKNNHYLSNILKKK